MYRVKNGLRTWILVDVWTQTRACVCVCACARVCVCVVHALSDCSERNLTSSAPFACVCVCRIRATNTNMCITYYIFWFAAELEDMIENNYQTLTLIYVTCEKFVAPQHIIYSIVDEESFKRDRWTGIMSPCLLMISQWL